MPGQISTPPRPSTDLIAGGDTSRQLDALFVNAPLRDYRKRPRVNDYTLPVLGLAYIETYAHRSGFNVGVLDAEAHGLGIDASVRTRKCLDLRWQSVHDLPEDVIEYPAAGLHGYLVGTVLTEHGW
ncbi:hypothetical protein [Streptomyces qinglanensis]|uniref:hypothetical protein n=1 Tax=Streptomyces qinglanensis TaxID=943816 RepID=UPI003D72EFF9